MAIEDLPAIVHVVLGSVFVQGRFNRLSSLDQVRSRQEFHSVPVFETSLVVLEGRVLRLRQDVGKGVHQRPVETRLVLAGYRYRPELADVILASVGVVQDHRLGVMDSWVGIEQS